MKLRKLHQLQLTTDMFAIVEGEAYYLDIRSYNLRSHYHSVYGWGQRLGISADWYLNRQHTLLLNTRYQHWFSDYSGLTKTDGYGYFYFALRYSMMDDRLRLSLVANDPFHQHITTETLCWPAEALDASREMYYPVHQFSHTNHHTHYIGLSATYSFGSKKVRRIQHDMKDTESERAQKR